MAIRKKERGQYVKYHIFSPDALLFYCVAAVAGGCVCAEITFLLQECTYHHDHRRPLHLYHPVTRRSTYLLIPRSNERE